jgi:hypothetical protein
VAPVQWQARIDLPRCRGCTALEKLSMAHNEVADLGDSLAGLRALQELRLGHNELTRCSYWARPCVLHTADQNVSMHHRAADLRLSCTELTL